MANVTDTGMPKPARTEPPTGMRMDLPVHVTEEALQNFKSKAWVSENYSQRVEDVLGWISDARVCTPGEVLPDNTKAGDYTVWVSWYWLESVRRADVVHALYRLVPGDWELTPTGSVSRYGVAYHLGATLVRKERQRHHHAG